MKKMISQCFVSMLFLFSIGLPGAAVAGSPEKPFQKLMAQDEKCYLSPGSLSMDEKRLYVCFNDVNYPINSVSVDEQGVYVLASELDDSKIIATCPVGHPNPPWNLVCSVCGRNLY